jgi:hypothetical protein
MAGFRPGVAATWAEHAGGPAQTRGAAEVIFVWFQRDTGHTHPHRDAAVRNDTLLPFELSRDEAAIQVAIEAG